MQMSVVGHPLPHEGHLGHVLGPSDMVSINSSAYVLRSYRDMGVVLECTRAERRSLPGNGRQTAAGCDYMCAVPGTTLRTATISSHAQMYADLGASRFPCC